MSTKINKTTIKCAVFDMDGTLLNTLKTINYYLNLALRKNGIEHVSEDECKRFVGYGARRLVKSALENSNSYSEALAEKVYEDYNTLYDADPYYLTEAYDGIYECLSKLRQSGITLAVLSNKPNFALREVTERFFPNTFSLARGAIDGVALKPAPDALLLMLSELDLTPEETAYIGDSEPDIETACNAKAALPISVTWGFRTRDQLLSSGATILADYPEDVAKIIIKK